MDGRKRFALVYQAGIANLFELRDGIRVRVAQSDFRACEYLAMGAGLAGAEVSTWACNEAGDIADRTWTQDLESQPFADQFRPVEVA